MTLFSFPCIPRAQHLKHSQRAQIMISNTKQNGKIQNKSYAHVLNPGVRSNIINAG